MTVLRYKSIGLFYLFLSILIVSYPAEGADFNDLPEVQLRELEACVCRCSLGLASHVGAELSLKKVRTYNPDASCAKLSNGPCIGGNLGCSRGFPKDSCIEQCLDSQGIQDFEEAAKTHFDAWSRKVRNDNSSGRKDSGSGFCFGGNTYGRVMIVPFKVLKEKGEDAWDEAEMVTFRTVIHEFDVIKTWHDSGTVIGHADMSTFTMGPNTTIMIAPPPEQESMVKLVLGNIWINAKKMLKDGSMDIEMNQAIAGARGTKFRCIENGYISEVQVYEGIVEIISKTTKEKILLYPGQGVKCSKNGLSQFSLQDLSHETSLVEKGDVYEGISSRSENGKITDQVISKNSFTNVQAAYVDMWHYQTPQLYLFKDTHYERYDLFASMSIGLNKITKGYPGITFETIDAAYVDARNSESPQLYLFSGVRYCRYDIRANKMVGVNTIKNGYPGLPFKTIDAAYVDSRNLGKPKLYLFSGSRYARYDILNDRYKGSNDIAKGYPGVTFKFIDAAYVDVSKPEGPQLYLFSGSNYARYDICTDKIIEINTNSKGKALGNGQKATSDNYEKAGAWH